MQPENACSIATPKHIGEMQNPDRTKPKINASSTFFFFQIRMAKINVEKRNKLQSGEKLLDRGCRKMKKSTSTVPIIWL
jgi:hypothetical protein